MAAIVRQCGALSAGVIAFGFAGAASAAAPMTYLVSHGKRNDAISVLTWGVMIVALVVLLVTTLLLVLALLRHRRRLVADAADYAPVSRPAGGAAWISIGVGVSTVVLLAVAVWTFAVLADTTKVPPDTDLTLQITAHQWWWEVRYLSDDASRVFSTANEIHVPVGKPVRVELIGTDVIHSFWVPTLTGKTDVIPGLHNVTWLQADQPGAYRGQCGEFCGLQHAKMALLVIASPPDQFDAWWRHQLADAAAPETSAAIENRDAFVRNCGVCHSVRGTPAGGHLGPDLSHLMTRRTIAAGTLPNTIGNLSGWISDPQSVKPGNLMPRLALSGPELSRVRNFLETLN